LAALVVVGLVGGCVSLDARPDMQRSAAEVERAVGVPAELLLHDAATAAETTEALLAEGLTGDEAVQVALLNNSRVRAAMLSIGVSRADFAQSTLFSNPTLFLSLQFPDGGGNPNVEVSLAQNIAELWLVPARKEAAQRDLDRVVLEAARSTAFVVLDVRQAYVRAVQAAAQVELAADGVAIAAKLVEIAELRQQAGSGSEVDLSLARATKLQVEADLRNARLAAVEAKAELSELMGLTEDPAKLVLIDALQAPAEWEIPAERLQAIARAERLDLRIMEESVASAEALAKLERVRFLRSVDVGFAFELMERRSRGDRNWLAETFYDSLQSGALTPPNLMPREPQSTDTIAGPTLSLELPLWDQNQAQIAKADRLLEQARQRRDALLVAVAQGIHASLARVRMAMENATIYRSEFVPTAERNVTLAQEGYRVGRVDFLSLLEAQRAYLATRMSELEALQAAALAEIELERVTGRPADVLRNAVQSPDESPGETTLGPVTEERAP
jgi:cobalt-zinc-cadmium efflux system outer membrane protein